MIRLSRFLIVIMLYLISLGLLSCTSKRVIEPVSIANDGVTLFEGDNPVISGDGSVVAFESIGLSDDFQNIPDAERWKYLRGQIYVRDLKQSQTEIVSFTNTGIPANARSFNPTISYEGRYISFQTNAENFRDEFSQQGWNYPLTPPPSFQMQTYVRDRVADVTYIVSKRPNYGDQILLNTYNASMAPNSGQVVHFAKEHRGSENIILVSQHFSSNQSVRHPHMVSIPTSSFTIEHLNLAISDNGIVVYVSGTKPASKTVIYKGSLNSTTIQTYSAADTGLTLLPGYLGDHYNPDISANGEYIVFESDTILPPVTGSGRVPRIYVILPQGTAQIASRTYMSPYMSGRNPAVASTGAIVFESKEYSPNNTTYNILLVPADFEYPPLTPLPVISKAADGGIGNGNSYNADISDDGKRIVFTSEATNLLTEDYNRGSDGKYVHISLIRKFFRWL